MGLLDKLGVRTYGGNWNLTETINFTEDDVKNLKGVVVSKNYGLSVCFHTIGSNKTQYIPVSNTVNDLSVGDIIDIKTAKILKLEREGDSPIYRVEAKRAKSDNTDEVSQPSALEGISDDVPF